MAHENRVANQRLAATKRLRQCKQMQILQELVCVHHMREARGGWQRCLPFVLETGRP